MKNIIEYGGNMVRELPRIKIGRKEYFVDARLNELRNVKNPFDVEKMEGSEEIYIKLWGIKKKE